MNLTGKQKAFLRSEAHHLQPVFQIGKYGLEEEALKQLEDVLEKRELIKVHLLQNSILTVDEAEEVIEEKTEATVVQKIGKTLVLFQPSSKEKYQKISKELPK